MDYKERCRDCMCLIEKGGEWCCDECFGQKCADITDCPEGVDEQAIQEMQTANKTKIDHGACGGVGKTNRKPRTCKISDEKTQLFKDLCDFLAENDINYQVSKENKLIFVKNGEKFFKIDLIESRTPLF